MPSWRIATFDPLSRWVVKSNAAEFRSRMMPAAVNVFECEATPEPVAWRHRLSRRQIGHSKRALRDEFAGVANCQYAARQLRHAYLIVQPVASVADCMVKPLAHTGRPGCLTGFHSAGHFSQV